MIVTPEEAKAAEEIAKGVQELAKTATQYQPSIHQVGEFFGRLIAPVEQTAGLISDHLKYKRIELAIAREQRIGQLLAERGIKAIRPMSLSVALPLIDAATIEEDEDLAEMFANLIVSHIDASSDYYLPKQFTQSVKQMTPFEAVVLKRMGSAPPHAVNESGFMYTGPLPEGFLDAPRPEDRQRPITSEKLELALSSLQQIGCIEGTMTLSSATSLRSARVTIYGRALLRACAPGDPVDRSARF